MRIQGQLYNMQGFATLQARRYVARTSVAPDGRHVGPAASECCEIAAKRGVRAALLTSFVLHVGIDSGPSHAADAACMANKIFAVLLKSLRVPLRMLA